MTAKQIIENEVYYRGETPGDKRRIKEPFTAAKGKTFVARTLAGAKRYGTGVTRFTAKLGARILRDDSPEFWRVICRRRPPNGYIGSAGRAGETLVDVVNKAIKKAQQAGYDAISMGDSDIGTVILNDRAFERAPVVEAVTAPSVLYHLTWSDYVPSILKAGIKPGVSPSRWVMQDAVKRSQGRVFLCSKERRQYWQMTYGDGWVKPPSSDSKLVWLKVDARGLPLIGDKAKGENYYGDYVTRKAIPPERVSLV